MGQIGVVRPVAASAIVAASACSIWAALDDPYKPAGSTADRSGADAGRTDGGDDAAAVEASARDASRVIDAGFVPFGIASYGGTVFAIDEQSHVHVSYSDTAFTPLWEGDAGGPYFLQTNGIAASDAGVFWTVTGGIGYCAIDGSRCGAIASTTSPRAIA